MTGRSIATYAHRRAQIAVLAACLTVVLAVIAFLSLDVMRRVEELAKANSDNVQWTLSAVQVELTEAESAALMAMAGTGSLEEVRQRFDVLYNRADIVTNGSAYSALTRSKSLEDDIAEVWHGIEGIVPLIDGPDEVLASEMSALAERLHALHAPLRTIAIEGVKELALGADRERATVVALLTRLALVTTALVGLLLVLLGLLFRLNGRMFHGKRELELTTSRLRTVINTATDAVIVVDGDLKTLDFNPAAEAIFGYSRDEVIGLGIHDLIAADCFRETLSDALERFQHTGELQLFGKGRIEVEGSRKSGETFPAEVSVSTAASETGTIFVAFIRDISDRKAAEAELLRARDDALAGEKAKAKLLAVMSHEMRTPLNGLLGFLELLCDTRLDARQREYLSIMEASGRVLLQHVNDVLDISRLDSGHAVIRMNDFDLGAVLSETVTMHRPLAASNGNRLVLEASTSGGMVRGDDQRLRHILINLLGNALKFTRNGTVTLKVHRPDGGDMVEIAVSDTGVGICEADLSRIFDEFYTADATYGRETEGTGLGLAITARLARLLGGEIGVESTPGQGSVFRVQLPLEPAATMAAIDETPAPGTEPETVPLNVLLVEDNHVNRRIARAMLEKLGHKVEEATDGAEGVEMAVTTAFDAILTDISMPRLDGIEAVRRIRSSGASRNARIIALTAHAMPDEIANFRAAGMDEVATKPVSRKQLAAILNDVRPITFSASDLSPERRLG